MRPRVKVRAEPKNLREYFAESRKITELVRWISREIWDRDIKRSYWKIITVMVIIAVIDAVFPSALRMVFDGLNPAHPSVSLVWKGFFFFAGLIASKRLIKHHKSVLSEYFFGVSLRRLSYRSSELFFEKSLGMHVSEDNLLNDTSVRRGYERTEQFQNDYIFSIVEVFLNVLFPFCALWWLSPLIGSLFTLLMAVYLVWAFYLNRQVMICCAPLEKRWRTLSRYRFERWHHVERVKTSGKEQEELATMDRTFCDIISADNDFWVWFIRQSSSRSCITAAMQLAVIGWGIHSVLAGTISIGWLYPLITWTNQITDNLWQIAEVEKKMNQAAPYIVAFKEALTLPQGLIQVSDPKPLSPAADYRIEFRNVGHAFPEDRGQGKVLHRISFTIEPGEKVALLGSSGVGKTTLMRLLLRYMDPSEGSIMINGVDLREIELNDWLGTIGYIPQLARIFDGTVRYNALYAMPASEQSAISDSELWKRMRLLQVDFGSRLTDGLETRIGHNGIKLSGGQNQRLMILAAAMKDPKFMVIDEATSSLDAITERMVQRGLEKVLEGRRGALIVTHRLSTVRRICDKFVMLKANGHGGQISAVAYSFEELADGSPEFRELAETQDVVFA